MSKKKSLKQLIKKISNYNYIEAHKTKQPETLLKVRKENKLYNRDMLPIGTIFFAHYEGRNYKCVILENGMYMVNDKQYDSLSEAAKAVTGVRTEGWRFWKSIRGSSVLEMFRKEK